MAGAYEISCPDSQCPKEGVFLIDEIEKIVGKELSDKHMGFRLNTGKNKNKETLFPESATIIFFNCLHASCQEI